MQTNQLLRLSIRFFICSPSISWNQHRIYSYMSSTSKKLKNVKHWSSSPHKWRDRGTTINVIKSHKYWLIDLFGRSLECIKKLPEFIAHNKKFAATQSIAMFFSNISYYNFVLRPTNLCRFVALNLHSARTSFMSLRLLESCLTAYIVIQHPFVNPGVDICSVGTKLIDLHRGSSSLNGHFLRLEFRISIEPGTLDSDCSCIANGWGWSVVM